MAHISTMEKLGIPAPGFSLPNLNAVVKEQTVSLETFEEYPALLVVFICNHCPYVVHIRDSFVSFVSEYDEKGLGVVAISSNDVESYPDDSPEQMTEDAVKYSYPFPYLFDERSEEHTSELQSRTNLVCRLLLEKKKKHKNTRNTKHTIT